MFFFSGVGALEPKRLKIGGVSFRVISSPINGARGNGFLGTKIVGSRPKTVIFWPFLAFGRHLGGLKDPLEWELKSKLVKLFMGHNLKAFRAKKIGPVGRGVRNQFGV